MVFEKSVAHENGACYACPQVSYGGCVNYWLTNSMISRPNVQKQAIEEYKLAFERLPHKDAIFQQCIGEKENLAEVLASVECKGFRQSKKLSARFMRGLDKYTTWLQNISDIVDTAA